ncbi:MAG: D-glycero-beta-D-manno-heptose-7-phosphate kinase [Methylobacteriaceae bacterium]|nr:D-glycero-beta-D-manno-heptose-7-phosphate kinase [Methylobacteriaceae bacterium]
MAHGTPGRRAASKPEGAAAALANAGKAACNRPLSAPQGRFGRREVIGEVPAVFPFETILNRFSDLTALVVGDVMLDRFVYGHVSRISPEAPAPVIKGAHVHELAGGAANVARNIASLGAGCCLVGVTGEDAGGAALSRRLAAEPLIRDCVVKAAEKVTTVKSRYVAQMHNTHLLRADWEDSEPLSAAAEAALLDTVESVLARCSVVILSDYDKGVLTPTVTRSVIEMARARGTLVVADPKGRDYYKYQGASLITPNMGELEAAVGHRVVQTEASVEAAAREMMERYGFPAVVVTRSEHGVTSIDGSEAAASFLAEGRRVIDVSGAGDTMVAGLALALAAGASLANAAKLANAASGIVVGKKGTATVTAAELRSVLLSRPVIEVQSKFTAAWEELAATAAEWREQGYVVGFTNGCFDILHPGHIALLRGARLHCDRLIVAINSDDSVRRLKGPDRPIQNEVARSTVLAALAFVDAVTIFDEDTPEALISRLLPDVLVKGADYAIEDVVGRDVVEAHGGRVVLVDLVPNSSTTGIVARARREARAPVQ